jgi:ABC-type multidrug transport system fused ATPase/permease subunit
VSSAKVEKAKVEKGEFRKAGRLLRPFVARQRRAFILALVMLTAEAVTAVAEPLPLGYLIDFLKGDKGPLGEGSLAGISGQAETIAILTIAIVLIAMINAAADSMAEIYLARGGRRLGYGIRVALYSNLQKLGLGFHNQRRTGDVLLRVTSDVEQLEKFVTTSVGDLAGSVLVLVGTLAFLLFRSWQVALVAVLIVPVLAFVSNYFSTRIRTASKEQRAKEGDLASAAQEMLTSIGVVQAFGRTDYEQERFAAHSEKAMGAALRSAGFEARFSWVVKVFEAVATGAIVWLGLWLIDRSAITVGTLIMFVILIQNMFKPTRKIIKEWSTIGKILASVDRIGDLLRLRPAVVDLPGAEPAPPLSGYVELDHVSFSYATDGDGTPLEEGDEGSRLALDDVTFAIRPGQVLGLVGHSGAGKSTIAQLLPRLYDPTTGRVVIDGQDIRTFTLDSLRSQISMVLQETILFSGTVADNIAYGRGDASRDQIVEAAMLADAHDFIEAMPEGYDTVLNERASNLSGGQRQRLAIARAFIRDTPILILDEPTTGLDAESTESVLGALRTLMRGKTTIIISHDLNLIRSADTILVLRAGEVVQEGSHADLLAEPGLYGEVFTRYFGVAEPGAPVLAGAASGGTGNGSANGHAGDGDDPLGNGVLRRELPGLAAALDAEAMTATLQRAVVGERPWVIEACAPGKATYLPDHGCTLRYELQLRHRETGAVVDPLVSARLFPTAAAAHRYARERLRPLVAAVAGRDEVAPFETPVATLDDLAMVFHAFPVDGELPTLVAATDRSHMVQVLREVLPEAMSGAVTLDHCRVHLGHYGRQHRCVLRYVVTGAALGSDRGYRRVVYGKVLGGHERGELAGAVIRALQDGSTGAGPLRFAVPEWLGYRPDLHLALLGAVPGAVAVPLLLKGERTPPGTPDAEAAIGECAGIAAALHRSGIRLGRPRTLEGELEWLRREIEVVTRVAPDLGARLERVRAATESEAARSRALPAVLCHGDYTHSQVVFDGSRPGLLDFDTVCQAEPALDLGQFLAYLRLAVRKASGNGASPPLEAALAFHLLDRYRSETALEDVDDDHLSERTLLYERVSLLRVAVHSWSKLKGTRLEQALGLLGAELDAVRA